MDNFPKDCKDEDNFWKVGIILGIGDILDPPKGPLYGLKAS